MRNTYQSNSEKEVSGRKSIQLCIELGDKLDWNYGVCSCKEQVYVEVLKVASNSLITIDIKGDRKRD